MRLVAEHPGLQAVLGCAPSQWACYRFARMLRERDGWALSQCVNDVLTGLHQQHPEMGHDVAIDGSDLPAYANGHRTKHDGSPRQPTDPDASWGHRSAVSTRKGGGFYGYKLHAAVDLATGLPIAWQVASAKVWEAHHAIPLIDKATARGFRIGVAIMDKGYDSDQIHQWCMERRVAPIIAIKDTGAVLRGKHKPPHCEHAPGRSPVRTSNARRPSGAARPASAHPPARGSRPTVCTR